MSDFCNHGVDRDEGSKCPYCENERLEDENTKLQDERSNLRYVLGMLGSEFPDDSWQQRDIRAALTSDRF